MRGQYNLLLSDGTNVPLRFCTWSLKRFCKLQGIGPSDIGDALSGSQSLDAITNLLKAAAEYEYVSKGESVNITDLQVCDWIDDMGGISGTKFLEVMNTLSESMNSDLKEGPVKQDDNGEVKKN